MKMLNYIGIILAGICIVAIIVASYMFYKRIKSQDESIKNIVSQQMKLESFIMKPSAKNEILSLFEAKTQTPMDERLCDDCDLKPIIDVEIHQDGGLENDDILDIRVGYVDSNGGELINRSPV